MWPFKKKETRGFPNIEDPGVPISGNNIMQLMGWDSGPRARVTHDNALTVPAVWSAVNFISSTIASLPLSLYKVDGDTAKKAKTDPLHHLLHDAPNQEWTSFRWRKYIMTQTLLRGRSYTYIERHINGKIKALWPLNPDQTVAVKDGVRTFYEFTERNGQKKVYSSDQIIDIPFMLDADQITHIDPVSKMSGAIGLSIQLQEYAERYFRSGGVPPAVLEGPFQSPGAVERAGKDLTKAIQESAAQGRLVVPIPLGHQIKVLGFNPEQGQLLEARKHALEEVARVYNLSPIFMQDLSNGTFSNTEQQDLHVVKHTITQWVKSIEQEMNLKLFVGHTRYVEFNLDGLLRGDFQSRMEGYSKAIQNSISTPNEVRAKQNDEPKEGGDDLMIQQNMVSTSKLGEVNDGN